MTIDRTFRQRPARSRIAFSTRVIDERRSRSRVGRFVRLNDEAADLIQVGRERVEESTGLKMLGRGADGE